MNKTDNEHRGTGKTTYMLEKALTQVLKGKRVLVVGWDHIHATSLIKEFLRLPEMARVTHTVLWSHLTVEVGKGDVRFIDAQRPDWQWDRRRPRGWDPTAPVFIDHYTEERHTAAQKKKV